MNQSENNGLEIKIRGITGAYLDDTPYVTGSIVPTLRRMNWVRMTRLARFWSRQERQEHSLLEQSSEDLVTGFYGQRCAWVFLLKGFLGKIECWVGMAQETGNQSSLQASLSGTFPGIRFAESVAFDYPFLNNLKYSLLLTGIPSPKTDPKFPEIHGEQIEKICRGLHGCNWSYIVSAQPMPYKEITSMVEQLAKEIRNTHMDYLLDANPTKRDRLAEKYVELVEAKLKRFEHGRSLGMWETLTTLLIENDGLSGRAQALLNSAFSNEQSTPEPLRVLRSDFRNTRSGRLPLNILNSRELAILTRPPHEEYPGYEIVDYVRFGVEPGNSAVKGRESILIGDIYDRGFQTGTHLALALPDVTKHGLIVGVTGSGKTNTCFWLLRQLWHEHRIPFLVIESAKSEYRSLLNMRSSSGSFLFNELKVFTIGRETVSPLRLNPFEVPPGIAIQMHIDYLKSLFSAAFVLYPPMPYVLEQSIQEVYIDRGWNLALNTNSRVSAQTNGSSDARHGNPRMFPTLSDLIAKVENVIQRMQYDHEITMNVRAGLVARLNQLRIGGGKGLMFNARQSVPSDVLFNSPCLLELKQLVSDDEKAFLIGLLLIRLYEYYESNPKYKVKLRHVTLIEEAHRLLRNVSTEQGSEVTANPKGHSIEVFANILSEIRAYGEGILIAEQIPTKLTPDAIKNTNLKIIHRLVAEDDRKTVGSTMNLTDSQTRHLTTLEKGEGIAYTEGMRKPVFLKVPLAKSDEEISDQLVKTRMQSLLTAHLPVLMRFTGCAFCPRELKPWECPYKGNEDYDIALKDSFLRFFNALRLSKPLVLKTYRDFLKQYQLLPTRENDHCAIYCVFAELVESELERRGEFGKWPYKAVDDVIRLACKIATIIVGQDGALQRKEFEKLYKGELIEFCNQLKNLHKIAAPPYPGCQLCNETERCLYRFDITYLDDDNVHGEDFQTYIMEDRLEQAINVCCYAGHKRFLPKDIMSSRGSALCFAVQQLNLLGLPTSRQEEKTKELKDMIIQTLKGGI